MEAAACVINRNTYHQISAHESAASRLGREKVDWSPTGGRKVGAVSSTLLGISHDKRVGAGGDSQGTGLAGEILGHQSPHDTHGRADTVFTDTVFGRGTTWLFGEPGPSMNKMCPLGGDGPRKLASFRLQNPMLGILAARGKGGVFSEPAFL
eukprot:scaffold128773_cov33-Phaeocystis_antarctica.AAC.1